MISRELQDFNAAAAARYAGALSPPARSYLNWRGITDPTIGRLKLGSVDGSIPEHADFTGRISVPYATKLGGIQGFKYRRVGDGSESKYLSDHMPSRLYNTLAFERAETLGYIAVCEGESDTWTLEECGIPAVGIPGATNWWPWLPLLFDGFTKVMIFSDPDDEGVKLKSRLVSKIGQAFPVDLKSAEDVNDVFLARGAGFIREAAGLE